MSEKERALRAVRSFGYLAVLIPLLLILVSLGTPLLADQPSLALNRSAQVADDCFSGDGSPLPSDACRAAESPAAPVAPELSEGRLNPVLLVVLSVLFVIALSAAHRLRNQRFV